MGMMMVLNKVKSETRGGLGEKGSWSINMILICFYQAESWQENLSLASDSLIIFYLIQSCWMKIDKDIKAIEYTRLDMACKYLQAVVVNRDKFSHCNTHFL